MRNVEFGMRNELAGHAELDVLSSDLEPKSQN